MHCAKLTLAVILLLCGVMVSGDDIEIIKTKGSSVFPARDYIKDEYKIEFLNQKISRDGKDIYAFPGTADRLLIKDFPEDIESLKIIAFMDSLYHLYSYSRKKQTVSEVEKQIVMQHREQLLNGYEFNIQVIGEKVSQYQTNYVETRYSLKQNEKILFENHWRSNEKETIKISFEEKTLAAVVDLIRKNSALKITIPRIYFHESKFGGKMRSWELSAIVVYEIPQAETTDPKIDKTEK